MAGYLALMKSLSWDSFASVVDAGTGTNFVMQAAAMLAQLAGEAEFTMTIERQVFWATEAELVTSMKSSMEAVEAIGESLIVVSVDDPVFFKALLDRGLALDMMGRGYGYLVSYVYDSIQPYLEQGGRDARGILSLVPLVNDARIKEWALQAPGVTEELWHDTTESFQYNSACEYS